TNCEQEYFKELHLGDHLSTTTTIESISEEKATGLGVGHFFTTLVRYTDQNGDLVATMRFRILKFKPGTGRTAAVPTADDTPASRPPRPRPSVTQDNAFFFEGAKQHKLLIQRCSSCGGLRHPPGPACPQCGSYDWDTVEASGRATVYSFVVNHYPQVPSFDYPLAVGLFELAEGTRLVANFVGVDADAIKVGMPVQVEFVDYDPELTLPAFRPVQVTA
ncbi:MAG: bifunctional MaoC family dehydratase/OB-fold nucleic acid binding domain-containing protein, partial [Actinobacteria bacterium]|nr:bifunctional MaoC family dehydratase/OB-fold nucleic acid binding domain-containing protein [Actinomycetota bacterium]